MSKGRLYIISAPSGAGKSTLCSMLINKYPAVRYSISYTTRAPRGNEINGKEYFFLSREEFISRIQENDFLEHDEHFGNYYGTPRSFVERQLKNKSVILEIDVVGALNAKRLMPQTVLIMIVPPDLKALQQRLAGRGSESEAQCEERMRRVRYELEQQSKYDYVVVNDDLQSSKRRLQEIIKSEQNKEC